jgi:SAM-dependent methyltransferase
MAQVADAPCVESSEAVMPDINQEPLELSAPLALQLSRQLCGGNPAAGGESCAWLHGFWQCLRLIGLAATPERHAGFYDEAFRAIRPAFPQVLVSGAADYGMVARIVGALPNARITVVDACETPLRLNLWYAAHAGLEIRTQCCGILDYASPTAFDVICTHSFFGQFSRGERPRLMAAWHQLLRPGGKVVTAHPLRPSGADEPNRFTSRQEEVLRERMAAHTEPLTALLGVRPEELLELAERYLRARYGYPVRSGEELAALFEQAGFEIERLDSKAPAPDAPPGSGGPGLRNPDVQYAHVIARRR